LACELHRLKIGRFHNRDLPVSPSGVGGVEEARRSKKYSEVGEKLGERESAMPSSLRISLAVAVAVLVSGFASATPLGLTSTTPDITSGYIEVTYNATTDAFLASGFALTYDDGSGPVNILSTPAWTLSATIDSSGVLSGGTLSIGTLLSGNLTDVGFVSSSAGALEFLFDVTGGSYASAYGSTGGVILGAPNGWTGSWASSFDNVGGLTGYGLGEGVADTFSVVPEPSTALLLAMGISALGWGGRRQG